MPCRVTHLHYHSQRCPLPTAVVCTHIIEPVCCCQTLACLSAVAPLLPRRPALEGLEGSAAATAAVEAGVLQDVQAKDKQQKEASTSAVVAANGAAATAVDHNSLLAAVAQLPSQDPAGQVHSQVTAVYLIDISSLMPTDATSAAEAPATKAEALQEQEQQQQLQERAAAAEHVKEEEQKAGSDAEMTEAAAAATVVAAAADGVNRGQTGSGALLQAQHPGLLILSDTIAI